jgi:hypothetical protein
MKKRTIVLLDTSGNNYTLAIKMPPSDYKRSKKRKPIVEQKEHKKQYDRLRNQRPDIKERNKLRMRKYRRKKRHF